MTLKAHLRLFGIPIRFDPTFVILAAGFGYLLFLRGELITGPQGMACEIGHMTIALDGRHCKCGNDGCLEAYASGPNIAARAREGLEAGRSSEVQ